MHRIKFLEIVISLNIIFSSFLTREVSAASFSYVAFNLAQDCMSVSKTFEGELLYKGDLNLKNTYIFVRSDIGNFLLVNGLFGNTMYIKSDSLYKRSGKLWLEFVDKYSGLTNKSNEISVWNCSIYADYVSKINKNINAVK